MKKIGHKIRDARKQKQVTQEDLASAVGVSDKSISAYESDRISPPLRVLEKIAKETEKPLSYFVEENADSEILHKLQVVEKQFDEIKKLLREMRG